MISRFQLVQGHKWGLNTPQGTTGLDSPLSIQPYSQPQEAQSKATPSAAPSISDMTPVIAEAGGSIWSLMNVVGVVATGVLAGVLLRMKQKKEVICNFVVRFTMMELSVRLRL